MLVTKIAKIIRYRINFRISFFEEQCNFAANKKQLTNEKDSFRGCFGGNWFCG